jgi:single-strand DNA-binding protein
MNKAIIIGRIGQEPKTKQFGETIITEATVATNKRYKSKEDKFEDKTTWHNITAFGYAGTKLSKLSKGSLIAVEGSIENTTYTNKKGETVNKSSIIVEKLEALVSNLDKNKALKNAYDKKDQVEFNTNVIYTSDSIPF